jgi:hypothetical protein
MIKKPCFYCKHDRMLTDMVLECDKSDPLCATWDTIKTWGSCPYGKQSPHYAEWKERHEDEKAL